VNNTRIFLKLAAAASSVVLVTGLVSYRAGALNWLMPSEAPTADVETSPPVDPPPYDPATTSPFLMSGSKSAIMVVPVAPAAKEGPAVASPAPPAIMPSSKSIAPLIPPKAPTPPASAPQSPVPDR
jgi:hypothetical protein